MQFGWCLYKKRKLGHTNRHQGYEDTEERPGKDTGRRWPSANQESPEKKPTCLHANCGCLIAGTVKNKLLVFKWSSLWYFVMATLAK